MLKSIIKSWKQRNALKEALKSSAKLRASMNKATEERKAIAKKIMTQL